MQILQSFEQSIFELSVFRLAPVLEVSTDDCRYVFPDVFQASLFLLGRLKSRIKHEVQYKNVKTLMAVMARCGYLTIKY